MSICSLLATANKVLLNFLIKIFLFAITNSEQIFNIKIEKTFNLKIKNFQTLFENYFKEKYLFISTFR